MEPVGRGGVTGKSGSVSMRGAGCWVLASGHRVHSEMDSSGRSHPTAGPWAHPSCTEVPDRAGPVTYSRLLLRPQASPGTAFPDKRTLCCCLRSGWFRPPP